MPWDSPRDFDDGCRRCKKLLKRLQIALHDVSQIDFGGSAIVLSSS